jgi:hypothetical protein
MSRGLGPSFTVFTAWVVASTRLTLPSPFSVHVAP